MTGERRADEERVGLDVWALPANRDRLWIRRVDALDHVVGGLPLDRQGRILFDSRHEHQVVRRKRCPIVPRHARFDLPRRLGSTIGKDSPQPVFESGHGLGGRREEVALVVFDVQGSVDQHLEGVDAWNLAAAAPAHDALIDQGRVAHHRSHNSFGRRGCRRRGRLASPALTCAGSLGRTTQHDNSQPQPHQSALCREPHSALLASALAVARAWRALHAVYRPSLCRRQGRLARLWPWIHTDRIFVILSEAKSLS